MAPDNGLSSRFGSMRHARPMAHALRHRHLIAVPDPPVSPPPPSLPANVLRLRPARCACRICGAYTIVDVCFSIGGNCQNCGSYDLVPVTRSGADG